MTPDSKVEALVNVLRQQIKKSDFGTKGRLPSLAQMAKIYQTGKSTVYQALQRLQAEGIVVARDKNYYVNYPLMRIPGSPLFDKFLLQQGLVPVTDNLVEPSVVPAPADIAVIFGLAEGAHVVHRMRKQGTAEVPYRLHENWYPGDLATPFLSEMKQDPNMNVAGRIREATGIAIANIHDDVFTRLPTPDEMSLLSIVRTTPVLEVRKHFLTQEGRTIMFVRSTLVGAYFQLSYDYPHRR